MTNAINSVAGVDDFATMVKDLMAERDKLQADLAAARAALRDLIGILEISAVMPDAIHKHMRVKWDDPGLQRARAALAEGKK